MYSKLEELHYAAHYPHGRAAILMFMAYSTTLPLRLNGTMNYNGFRSRLGGVVVSVLATGSKVCWFEPGQRDGFLRAIKIRSTPSSRMGNKAGWAHVVRFTACKKTLEVPQGWID
jgi:hypothetical protein